MTSQMYFHIIVTVVILVSMVGVLFDANAENMIHESTITAPSIQTPTYDFINDFSINDVVFPAKDASDTGAISV